MTYKRVFIVAVVLASALDLLINAVLVGVAHLSPIAAAGVGGLAGGVCGVLIALRWAAIRSRDALR